jgi:uncharacterized protein (TIGR02266 family)
LESSKSLHTLTSAVAERIQEFLPLNRRRFRRDPPLSGRERDRWSELRWQIEEALGGPARKRGPRRRALRVPSNLKVEVRDPRQDEVASAREIAEGGLFLATERPVPVGTPLHLKLTGDGGETVEVEGAVVWVRKVTEPGGPPGIGVEFANLDNAQRAAVAYLVDEALAAL